MITDIHLLSLQTETDKNRLFQNLKNQKKDFRLELIIFGVFWLVAPFLPGKSNQKPLIENMTYGKALLVFGIIFLIPLLISYFKKLHKAVRAYQTDVKRIIITSVIAKKKNPIFHKDKYRLQLGDSYLRKLYLPRHDFDRFEIGNLLKIEISETGKQLIRIVKANENIIKRVQNTVPAYPGSANRSYTSVLFNREKSAGKSKAGFFAALIPGKQNFISTIILYTNILIFIAMLISGVSIYKPQVIDMVNWGGNIRVLTIGKNEYWRLATNIFIHAGIIHLLMNILGFILISLFVEPILGHKKFLLLYFFTGLCASLTSLWWHTNVVSVGASGAILGLYGFFLALLVLVKKEHQKVNASMIVTVLIFIGYSLIAGLKGNTDNAAHIGGLIAGFFAGVVMTLYLFYKRKEEVSA